MHRLLIGATGGLFAGLGVVSATAAITEQSFPAPKYSSSGKRYDQSNFGGRLATMLSTMNPTTLLASDEEVMKAAKLVKDYENGSLKNASDADLWKARLLRDSAVHPDTEEIIPRPFRMAGYVPFNGPVCVAMILSSSTPTLLFWNWVNQSQNALVNYYNRNASSPSTNETLAKSYATAVSCALMVAFGVSQVINRRFDPTTAKKLLKFVALPSSMVASSANAYIMRSPEIAVGVKLYTSEDLKTEVVASSPVKSNVAAKKAVMETVYSRILLQVPTFFIPPLFMMIPPIAALAANSAVASITLNTFVTLVGFGLGLPAAVAVFPQTGVLSVDEIEPELKQKAAALGLSKVYYNKGL